MTSEIHLKVLREIEKTPSISQRELAKKLGVSLGKTNYCLKALLGKGLVRAKNFKNNNNKIAYTYLLTPKGIEEKGALTFTFLKRKRAEYEALKQEIKELSEEAKAIDN